MDALLGERELSKLKWRCRRGLLENDLFVERFFQRYENTLTVTQARGLQVLMDLADNDLLDLLLRRKEPQGLTELGDFAQAAEVHEVLALMRSPPLAPKNELQIS
jgi:antitoxin CptB